MAQKQLPTGFDDLQIFVEKWALPTERERNHARLASSMEEIRRFYDSMAPRMDAAVEHLNKFTVESFPEPSRRLFQLALSFMEVSHAVEVWGTPDIDDSFPADRLEFMIDR